MLFSIVVPVYNAEKYLKNTVESVLNQSFADWELVLVDDGSTDESLKLCREFEAADRRIRALSQPNGGPSAARNAGIDAAQGEYVLFLDSDDEYLPGALEAVAAKIEQTAVDLVVSAMRVRHRDSHEILMEADYDLGSGMVEKEELCSILRQKRLAPGPCRYAIKRRLLAHHRVYFPLGISIAEDCLWLCTMLSYVKNAAFNEQPFYQYNVRSGSITTTMSFSRLQDLMTVCERLFALAQNSTGELQALRYNYCCILANSMLQNYGGQSKDHRKNIRGWVRQHNSEFSVALRQQPLIRAAALVMGDFLAMWLFAVAVKYKVKLSGR